MDAFFDYSEDLNYHPVEYTDNDFIYDIKGIYRAKLNFFEKLVPSGYFKYLNNKKGLIIKISEFGIKNPQSKYLKWENIDYIKARKNRLELSSRMGNIVNINYRIEDFDLIALKILKLATPLEALNWFKQVTFKPQKTILYYLKYYLFVVRVIMSILLCIWLPFFIFSSEGPLIIEMFFSLFYWYLAYHNIRTRFIVSISIQKQSIIFYEQSIIMNAIFSNFSNPNKYEFDIHDITNIIIGTSSYEENLSLFLTISLLKSDGYIISLIPGGGPINSVDPIPIYYRLKSILVNQK